MTGLADVVIIGAGIAGASLAARLAGSAKVILLEMEDHPGYHSTGRSAAMYEPTFGPPAIRALTRASGDFFHRPPDGFCDRPLVTERGALLVAEEGDESLIGEFRSYGYADIDEASARAMVPLLRTDLAIAFLFDGDTKDIDVDAFHQGFMRQHRRAGGKIVCGAAVASGRRERGVWLLETSAGRFESPVIVIAAGAWCDEVAIGLGLAPLGLQPKRRSAVIVPVLDGTTVMGWPQVFPAREDFYCKPVAGKLMISPSDATPVEPHDAFADDLKLAEGIAAFERLINHPVTRVERSWGGLRTFAPDGNPVVGFDPTTQGVFWLAGQGGYGIQTSPALSMMAASLINGVPISAELLVAGVTQQMLSPSRLR
jgi:D-arginine dehydrogenase